MKYSPDIHHRRSIRLKGHDYSHSGLYFITICTQHRLCLFGEINSTEMVLNEYGEIVKECLTAIPDHYPHAKLHQYIVMPNHIHCIVEIMVGANNNSPLPTTPLPTTSPKFSRPNDGAPPHGTSKTIGSIVRGFKIGVTKYIRRNADIHTVWQRNYYEHIIRNEKSYDQISEYIQTNPLKWQGDKYYA